MAHSVKSTKEEGQSLDFFAISCFRLYIFSVLSLGLYSLYWAYKNWKCIQNTQDASEKQISPVWRGWLLSVIWFLPLCIKIVTKYKAALGKYLPFAIFHLICFYGIFFCLGNTLPFLLFLLAAPLMLLPFQRLINQNTDQIQKLTWWDYLICLIGLLLMFFIKLFYFSMGF